MSSPNDVRPLTRATVERQGRRLINGIRYLAGSDFAPAYPTPKETVWRQGKVQLWRYRADPVSHASPVLVMLGLVSRSSLFDLHEKVSLVRKLRDAGFDCYVLDWGVADAGDANNTLETYVSTYLLRAVRAMLRASDADDFTLIGYCMGGNLALLAAAAHPNLPLRNLVIMATGVDWDHMHPQVNPLRKSGRDASEFTNADGLVPGEVFAYFFKVRKPTAPAVQYLKLWQHLDDHRYVEGHQAIGRWAKDHVPVPYPVAHEILRSWLRENAFMTGRLQLDGKAVNLKSITCPVLAILTMHDEIVPPAAARPILSRLGSSDAQLLELDAGHVGLVVGRSAHQVMHPRLLDWLTTHGLEIRNRR